MKGNKTVVLVFVGFFSFFIVKAQEVSWEKRTVNNLSNMADSLTKNLKPWKVPSAIFKVESYGAIADGQTLNTVAIQKAIDACSKKGGGTVLFSNGNYVTGTIVLKSNVMLEVSKKAKILGSTNIKDYPYKIESFVSIMSETYEFKQSLIYAEKAINVGIKGKGEIYFRGEKVNFPGPETIGKIVDRPLGIRMIECKNIVLQDISLKNSAAWMQNYLYCENLIFDGINVFNHANYNNDGLDPDGCKNVIVRNCFINSEDDAMCLKGASNRLSENILIENSTFYSTCNSLKIGTDTQGSFKNIIARNLVLGGVPKSFDSFRGYEVSSGITLATVDGGNVENIFISNITIDQSRCPIFIRIGSRGRVIKGIQKPISGSMKQVVITNVKGKSNFVQGSLITGIGGHVIEDVVIRNVNISMEGGGTKEMANATVAEDEGGYPDAGKFSRKGLPSYGFYIRHARNILLDNVKITPINSDDRPDFKSGGDIQNIIINGNTLDK
ncbi:glycoside hydrolase family 28 protein [Flavobacterium sp. WC2509]|uniref:glycoside hydrolase family 28 protein n=1 Tax=Flavobacterium sp. WC2509 TaxID=3461406 RepID=UPI00404397C8